MAMTIEEVKKAENAAKKRAFQSGLQAFDLRSALSSAFARHGVELPANMPVGNEPVQR